MRHIGSRGLIGGLGLAALVLLGGCAAGRSLTISSDPPGARVLADGRELGETPLTVQQDEAFPPRWIGSSYMVKGTLALEKPGCARVSMPVDDGVLSRDIDVSLQCEPGAAPAADQPVTKTGDKPAPVSQPAAMASGDIEQRLQRLRGLHEKGLITDEEYAEQRKRVLDSI